MTYRFFATASCALATSLLSGCASTPASDAYYKGDLTEMMNLVRSGQVKVNDQLPMDMSKYTMTPLCIALTSMRNESTVKELVNRGADVNLPCGTMAEGLFPLDIVMNRVGRAPGFEQYAELLLWRGARSKNYGTPTFAKITDLAKERREVLQVIAEQDAAKAREEAEESRANRQALVGALQAFTSAAQGTGSSRTAPASLPLAAIPSYSTPQQSSPSSRSTISGTPTRPALAPTSNPVAARPTAPTVREIEAAAPVAVAQATQSTRRPFTPSGCMSHGTLIPPGKQVCFAQSMLQYACRAYGGKEGLEFVQKLTMRSSLDPNDGCDHIDRTNLKPPPEQLLN
jgi:hypothetical protein